MTPLLMPRPILRHGLMSPSMKLPRFFPNKDRQAKHITKSYRRHSRLGILSK